MANIEMWSSLAPLLAAFEALARDERMGLLKVDGERDANFFTVVLDRKRDPNAWYRRDGDDLAVLLEDAISYGRADKPAAGAGERQPWLSRLLTRFARTPPPPGNGEIAAENVERWRTLAPLLAAFEALGRDDGVVLLQMRGVSKAKAFIVTLTGKRFADAPYCRDDDDLAALLVDAIRHAANHDPQRADP